MFMRTLILLLSLVAVACSPVDEITPRKYVGLIVGHTASVKNEIAKSLISDPQKPVPQAGALQLPPPPGLAPMKFDFGWITKSGAIVIQSKEYGVIVLQEPALTHGEITWSCVVSPADAKPNLCGADKAEK